MSQNNVYIRRLPTNFAWLYSLFEISRKVVDEAIDDTIVDIVENPEKLTVLDTIEDPSINEIFDE